MTPIREEERSLVRDAIKRHAYVSTDCRPPGSGGLHFFIPNLPSKGPYASPTFLDQIYMFIDTKSYDDRDELGRSLLPSFMYKF